MMPIVAKETPAELFARKRAESAEQQLSLALETIDRMRAAAAEQHKIINGLSIQLDELSIAARAYLDDATRTNRWELEKLL